MSYKNHHFQVFASDYFSPGSRDQVFVRGFLMYPKIVGVSRVAMGSWVRGDMLKYVCDISMWQKCHEELKAKALVNYHFVEKLIDDSLSYGAEMNKWTEKNIFKADLTRLDNRELWQRYSYFLDMQTHTYALGTTLPVLDFQGFAFVEGNLKKILENKLPPEDYAEAFHIFTEPLHNSFAQDQEEDLLKLMDKYCQEKNWRESKEFQQALTKHTQKYAWVYYVYAGPAFTEKDFLAFVGDYLKRGVIAAEKLAAIKTEKKQILEKRQQYLKKIQPNDFEMAMLNLAGKLVWGKPRRKDLQSKSYYHVEKLQREIGKRLFLTLNQVRSAEFSTIEHGLQGKEMDINRINQLMEERVVLPNDDDSLTILTGQEAKDFVFQFKEEEKNQALQKEIRGVCAFPGHVQGRVRIINSALDMHKMEYGDILVSTATTPAIVMAMKKAAAIVTDEGGLTCHASIVSRELHIPCVVGTKIATEVLKDGDLVEVDATKGIIKKI